MDCFPGEPQDGQEGSSPRVRAAPEKTARYFVKNPCSVYLVFFFKTLCCRFERTADMLAKSGLLEITMKTADLIRSNQQAQRELNQLKVLMVKMSTPLFRHVYMCSCLLLLFLH